jgi:hypothetical protein
MMFRFVALVWLFASGTALAQEAGDKLWITEDVVSKRFFDENSAGPEFGKEARVTVVMVDGERTRIMQGSRFGWVPSTNLTSIDPNPPPPSPLGGGLTPPANFELPPGFDLGSP